MLDGPHEVSILKSPWAYVRRFFSAVMLMAALSFALHVGAVAADFGDIADCHGHAGSVTAEAGHVHADGGAQTDIHASAAHADHDRGGQKGHCKVPCCGTGCTIAVLAAAGGMLAPSRISAGRPTAALLFGLIGTDPAGLERPPQSLMPG